MAPDSPDPMVTYHERANRYFAEKLARELKADDGERGWQKKLALKTGVPPSALSGAASKTTPMGGELLERLATGLGKTYPAFLEEAAEWCRKNPERDATVPDELRSVIGERPWKVSTITAAHGRVLAFGFRSDKWSDEDWREFMLIVETGRQPRGASKTEAQLAARKALAEKEHVPGEWKKSLRGTRGKREDG